MTPPPNAQPGGSVSVLSEEQEKWVAAWASAGFARPVALIRELADRLGAYKRQMDLESDRADAVISKRNVENAELRARIATLEAERDALRGRVEGQRRAKDYYGDHVEALRAENLRMGAVVGPARAILKMWNGPGNFRMTDVAWPALARALAALDRKD